MERSPRSSQAQPDGPPAAVTRRDRKRAVARLTPETRLVYNAVGVTWTPVDVVQIASGQTDFQVALRLRKLIRRGLVESQRGEKGELLRVRLVAGGGS